MNEGCFFFLNRQDECRDEVDNHEARHEALCGCRNELQIGSEPLIEACQMKGVHLKGPCGRRESHSSHGERHT